jgi:hypothetical protein
MPAGNIVVFLVVALLAVVAGFCATVDIIVFFLPLILIAAGLTLVFPRNAVLLFFAFCFSLQYMEKIIVGSFTGLDAVGIFVPLFMILTSLNRRKSFLSSPEERTYSILLAAVIVALLLPYSTFPVRLLDQLGAWLKMLNLLIVLWAVRANIGNQEDAYTLLRCILVSAIIPVLLGMWQFLTGATLSLRGGYQTMDAFFHHPGVISYILVFSFPLLVFFFTNSRRRSKASWGWLIAVALILLYFTYRRTVWVGLLGELIVWFSLSRKKKSFFVLLGIVLFFTLFFKGGDILYIIKDRLVDIPKFFVHSSQLFNEDRFDYLFTGRWGIFRVNLIRFYQQDLLRKVFGNGLGSTTYFSRLAGIPTGGHNNFLILLMDTGLLGLVSYLVFIFLLVRRAMRMRRAADDYRRAFAQAFLTFVSGYLIMGMGTHLIYRMGPQWMFAAMAGILIGPFAEPGEKKKEPILQVRQEK